MDWHRKLEKSTGWAWALGEKAWGGPSFENGAWQFGLPLVVAPTQLSARGNTQTPAPMTTPLTVSIYLMKLVSFMLNMCFLQWVGSIHFTDLVYRGLACFI